jgi:hypothetical protein
MSLIELVQMWSDPKQQLFKKITLFIEQHRDTSDVEIMFKGRNGNDVFVIS